MASSTVIKIFVSSPGDVGGERLVVERVLERLQGEFLARLKIEPVFWEHEPVVATADYQSQFPLASSCDIVVCILWSRLGTRLPDKFGLKPDGSRWESGTEFEFEDALRAHRERGMPDLLVYRKTSEPLTEYGNETKVQYVIAQRRALDVFLERWFGGPDTGFTAGFTPFSNEHDFEEKIEAHLRRLLEKRVAAGSHDAAHAAVWHQGSPFRGLESFGPEHAPIFFGRTKSIFSVKDLLVTKAVRGPAFLLLLGGSGSGKSSLLRAGIIPTVTSPGVVAGVGLWRVAFIRPGDSLENPLESLTAGLTAAGALPELVEQGYDAEQLVRLMSEAPQMIDQPVHSALLRAATVMCDAKKLTEVPTARLLLVVDQFEQLFTMPGFDDASRARFITTLAALAHSGRV